MILLFENLVFILFLNTLVLGHQSKSFGDVAKKLPDVKDEGLWTEYDKHDFMHDLHHLKEEANKLLYMQESDQLTIEQSAFYYTRLHDFNNDGGLDGLELLLAVKHSMVHQNSSYETADLEHFSDHVDSELKLMDLNSDGLVDYGEIYTYMQNSKFQFDSHEQKDNNTSN